jgi:hypothetical protein
MANAASPHDRMTVYTGKREDSAVETAEFVQIDGERYALLHLRAATPATFLPSVLAHVPTPVAVTSELTQESGDKTVLLKLAGSEQSFLDALKQQGDAVIPKQEKDPKFNPWFWRGATSIVGQSLQLASSFTTYNPKNVSADGRPVVNPDGAIFGFAALNLMANACNMTFGSQHKPDAHQLKYLKEAFNQQWQPYAVEGKELPAVDGSALHRREQEKQSLGEKVHGFFRAQSVTFGEVGLRMLGTTSLIAPITAWPKAIEYVMQGNLSKAAATAINPDKATLAVGLTTMVGKISGLVAKEQDPYNPKPKTAIDTFRENIAFKLSSVIEGGAATYMMVDRLHNKRTTIGYDGNMNAEGFAPKPNETLKELRARPDSYMKQMPNPDWAGVAGNFLFIDGYVMRYFAKVGSLDVDMKELCAHVSDGLSTLPKEQIPDALAATALSLKLHFHDKKDITAAGIYEAVADDLRKQHVIDVSEIRLANIRQEGARAALKAAYHAPSAIKDIAPKTDAIIAAAYEQRVQPQEALARA